MAYRILFPALLFLYKGERESRCSTNVKHYVSKRPNVRTLSRYSLFCLLNYSCLYLVRGPEEVAAQRHHPTLVRLLQELGGVLGSLRRERVVVHRVEPFAREQRARHRHQRSHLRLAVRKLIFVQNEGLLNYFRCDFCINLSSRTIARLA